MAPGELQKALADFFKPFIQTAADGTVTLRVDAVIQAAEDVNLIKVGGTSLSLGQALMAAGIPVSIASDQSSIPVAATLQAGAAVIGHVIIDSGSISISSALPAGTNVIGKISIDQTTPGTTNLVQTKRMPDATSTFAPTSVKSPALENGHILKASPGVAYAIFGTNTKAAGQWILVFNAVSAPPDGTVPDFPPVWVNNQGNFSIDFGDMGAYFSVGIFCCNSSTAATKTIGAADCFFFGLIS